MAFFVWKTLLTFNILLGINTSYRLSKWEYKQHIFWENKQKQNQNQERETLKYSFPGWVVLFFPIT